MADNKRYYSEVLSYKEMFYIADSFYSIFGEKSFEFDLEIDAGGFINRDFSLVVIGLKNEIGNLGKDKKLDNKYSFDVFEILAISADELRIYFAKKTIEKGEILSDPQINFKATSNSKRVLNQEISALENDKTISGFVTYFNSVLEKITPDLKFSISVGEDINLSFDNSYGLQKHLMKTFDTGVQKSKDIFEKRPPKTYMRYFKDTEHAVFANGSNFNVDELILATNIYTQEFKKKLKDLIPGDSFTANPGEEIEDVFARYVQHIENNPDLYSRYYTVLSRAYDQSQLLINEFARHINPVEGSKIYKICKKTDKFCSELRGKRFEADKIESGFNKITNNTKIDLTKLEEFFLNVIVKNEYQFNYKHDDPVELVKSEEKDKIYHLVVKKDNSELGFHFISPSGKGKVYHVDELTSVFARAKNNAKEVLPQKMNLMFSRSNLN